MNQFFYSWLRDKVWICLDDSKHKHPNGSVLVDEKINSMDNCTLLEYFEEYERESYK